MAILVGDLAAVFADRLFLESGFAPGDRRPALDRYHRMRTAMAVGQFLDVAAGGGARRRGRRAPPRPSRAASTRVEGPLLIGAALAGATEAQRGVPRPASADRSAKRSSSATTWRTARRRTGLPPRRSTGSSTRRRPRSTQGARPRVRGHPRPTRRRGGDVTDDLETLRRLFRDPRPAGWRRRAPHGGPHIAARWFVWREDALYVATRVGDTTWEPSSATAASRS